jgi:hypothetical protein
MIASYYVILILLKNLINKERKRFIENHTY